MIRIQLIVPLFAISCYLMLRDPTAVFNKFVVEPVREIYEAFVIYTFFSLLTDMLGGAKSIVIMTSGRPPVDHPGFMKWIFPPLDISDPRTFLAIKRGILQYVWLKPLICFGVLFSELLGWYNVNDMGVTSLYLWFTIVYNFSVSLSLYCLAIFWKILWNDLKPFNPMGKFLCVKLIIFASYWQGVILAILNFVGVLPGDSSQDENGAPNIGVSIQNALLCVELIAFAIGHWFSFSYKPFTISHMPSGRVKFYYALRDMFGIKDLVIDFALTFYGDYYKDYKQFDSVEALIAHPSSKSRMGRINQGLRYQPDGKQKHWLPSQNLQASPQAPASASIRSTSEINAISNHIYHQQSGRSQSIYAPSLVSTGTSTRAIYSNSPKGSPPASPLLSDSHSIKTTPSNLDEEPERISEVLKKINPEVNYDDELLDEDEQFFQAACSVVNNYNLDQSEVKQLINYPIVDELISGHEYGYKVKKLRADRLRHQQNLHGYGSV
ncbi:hypothetical protein QG37_06058 [Candidozyma auris]|nr:hypothetical protein QG37_06058 [[Candida] auris]